MNPAYFNALHGLLQDFLMFTVGTPFNFRAFKLLGIRGLFYIRFVFVMKLAQQTVLQQTVLLGQRLLAFKSAQLEIEIM